MSDIDNLLQAQSAGAQVGNVDSLLSAQAKSTPTKEAIPAPTNAPSKGSKVAMGLGDTEYGLGQLAEHIPVLSTITKGWRMLIQEGLKGAGFNNAADAVGGNGDPTSGDITDSKAAANFDSIVHDREKEYHDARQAAGETGIDWWRLGGQAANPINYLGPGGAAYSVAGRIGQGALQGATIGAEQPETTPGNFWWDKAKSMGGGALGGGVASGLIEAATPALKAGIKIARKVLGNNINDTNAAESIVNDALRAKGKSPSDIDLNVYAGMKKQVQEAIDAGSDDITHEAIANQAIANSLPVPVKLLKGQATGDPMLYSAEQNLRGVQGVGEPITQRLQEQNQAFIQNLDALGAKDAPDTVSTGQQISQGVQQYWDGLQQHKDQLYDAVKNSDGLSAKLDGQSAGQEIRETLGSPQAMHAWMTLPENMKATIHDLEEGKLDLTVSQLQALDKAWGADARAADGSTAHAINSARTILSNAKINEESGQEAMQAYQAAKQAHAQQMSLINPKLMNGHHNDNYQPLVKAIVMDGKVDNVFDKGFMNAPPSEASKNLKFLSQLDPNSNEVIGRTFMGEIKRQALSNASDERGTVSQSVLGQWARTPVKSARMEAIMPDAAVQTFRNLADTVEVAKRFPIASTVNTSNTGSAVVNALGSALKTNAAAQVLKRIPGIKGGIVEPIQEGMKQGAAQTAVKEALTPGVTLKSLLRATPKQAATNRALSRLATPAVAAYMASKPPQD